MIGFQRQLLAPALLVMLQALTPNAAWSQVTYDHTQLEPNQRIWLDCVDRLLTASDRRYQSLLATDERLCELAASVISVAGGDAFKDAVLSLDATFSSDERLQAWVRDQFVTHLFPVDGLKDAERRSLRTLDEELSAIDGDVLVELGYDIELAEIVAKYPPTQPTFHDLDLAVSQLVRTLLSDVKQAQVKQFATAAGGIAAGHIAGNAALDAMRDENGEASTGAWLASWVVDAAASAVVETTASQVVDTEGQLRRLAIDKAQTLVQAYIVGAPAKAREATLAACARRHNIIVFEACVKELGLDREWAADVYNKRIQARAAEKHSK